MARCARCRRFTLIEMMITVVLVGILASVVVPLTEMSVRRGKEQELRIALREIRSAIDAYKRAGDEGRIYRSATTTGYPATLDTLVEGVQDQKDPGRRKIYSRAGRAVVPAVQRRLRIPRGDERGGFAEGGGWRRLG